MKAWGLTIGAAVGVGLPLLLWEPGALSSGWTAGREPDRATARMSYEESSAIKREMVAAIPGARVADYELDHCIPLCLGGSNTRSNLQLQLWVDARIKDKAEATICRAVSRGEMTQDAGFSYFRKAWGCK